MGIDTSGGSVMGYFYLGALIRIALYDTRKEVRAMKEGIIHTRSTHPIGHPSGH